MSASRRIPLSAFQLRLLAVVAIVVLAGFALAAAPAVLVAFIGIMFGVFFSALARGVQKLVPLGYRASLAIAMLLLLLLVGLLTIFVVPQASAQARKLRQDIPVAWDKAQQRIAVTSWGRALIDTVGDESKWIPEAKTLTRRAAGIFTTALGAAGAALAAIFLGLFLAIEPNTYARGVVSLFPRHRRPRAAEVLDQLGRVLRRWLVAKFISMGIVGVLTGIGLWLLDIPLALSLAIFASLLTFIPNIGPVIAALPALLLGFVQGPSTALYIALLYIGVQTIESYGITPFIERETVLLPPALTLTAQLTLGLIAGFIGVIVATPLLAVGIVLVQTLYIQDVLGDCSQSSIGDAK